MVIERVKIVYVCTIDDTEWPTRPEAEAHERELLKKAIEEIATGPGTYFYTESTCRHLAEISHILLSALRYTGDPAQYLYYRGEQEENEAALRELLGDISYRLVVMWNVCGQCIDNAPDVFEKLSNIVHNYLPEEVQAVVTDEMLQMTDRALAFYMDADKNVIPLVDVEDLISIYKDKVDMADSVIKGWRDHKD